MANVDDAISMQSRPPLRQQGSVSAGRTVGLSRWTWNNPAVNDDEPKSPPSEFEKNTNAVSQMIELHSCQTLTNIDFFIARIIRSAQVTSHTGRGAYLARC